jgi:hypothetical protein
MTAPAAPSRHIDAALEAMDALLDDFDTSVEPSTKARRNADRPEDSPRPSLHHN